MNELCAFGFFLGVEPEDDRDCLAPIGAFSLGVQQPNIARQMLLIVGADAIKLWGLVFEGRNGHRLARALVPSLPEISHPQLIWYGYAWHHVGGIRLSSNDVELCSPSGPRKTKLKFWPVDIKRRTKPRKAPRQTRRKRNAFAARLTIDVTPDLRARIKIMAFERGVTVAYMLRLLLLKTFPRAKRGRR